MERCTPQVHRHRVTSILWETGHLRAGVNGKQRTILRPSCDHPCVPRFSFRLMKVISTFHPSSSVVSSLKCRLGTRDIEHLVVAKLNRLDVYSVRPHGLQHECGVEVWGKVCAVKSIPLSVSRVLFTIPLSYL